MFYLFKLAASFLRFRSRLASSNLLLKGILCKFADILPELNQFFVGHAADFKFPITTYQMG